MYGEFLLNEVREVRYVKFKVWGILIGTLLVSCLTYSSTSMVDIRGFGTLSGTYSDSDTLAFRRDLTQEGITRQVSFKPDSLLGVQTDVHFSDALKASVQVVAKDRINNSLDESITWANLSYDFDNAWNLRAGRIGSDLTLIGDIGNIGYAYDWVRPPADFYSGIPFYHFDGAELLYRHALEEGHIFTKVFYGRSGSSFKYHTSESEFDLVPFSGVAVRYESGGFTYRAAYARTEIDSLKQTGTDELIQLLTTNASLPGVVATLNQLDSKNSPIDYYATGFEYRFMSWKWLAEASFMDTDMALVLPSASVYTGLVKRFNNFALYGLLAHARTTQSPCPANSQLPEYYQTIVQHGLDSTDFEQTTASIGMRWDIATNLALKGQWDRSWVSANKDLLWDGDEISTDEQVNVFALSMSFIF